MTIEVDIDAGRAIAAQLAAARTERGAPAVAAPATDGDSIRAAVDWALTQWQHTWDEADDVVASFAQRLTGCLDRYCEADQIATENLARIDSIARLRP